MPARSPVPATFAPPPKGLFTHESSSRQNTAATSAAIPITRKEESVRSSAGEDDQAGMLPSSVPSKGRRRESLGAQMRKGLNLGSPASVGAASLGHAYSYGQSSSALNAGSASIGSGSSAATTLGSRPIGIAGGARTSPTSTFAAGRYASSMSRGGGASAADLSTSFGTAAEALSLSLGRGGPLSSSLSVAERSDGVSIPGAAARKNAKGPEAGQKSLGHSHFGQECFGPSDFDASLPNVPPSKAALAQLQANSEAQAQKGVDGDAAGAEAGYNSSDQLLHKCESCAKVYRHPSCLIKHRWEHTVYWKEASKFLLSKHQQVQLLEAAAILVGMDCESRSLPEEKALWPAAVSPPESGLLGSEVFNYDKLMEGRRARQGQRATSPSMSPLNNLSQLHLDSGSSVTANTASASATKPGKPSSVRAGSADAASTVPEEDLMEDVTRSSTTTATRTTSSTGRSSAHDADSPGRMTSSSSGADGEEELDEEEEEEIGDERDRSPGGSGGDVVGTFEMEE